MGRTRGTVVLASLAGLLIALALPAVAQAHQIVRIEGGQLIIEGDHTKEADEVTVVYDSVKDEYVIGHDIEDPIPAGCYRDAIEPFHKLHCPASGITKIVVNLGNADDKFKSENLSDVIFTDKGPFILFLPKDLQKIELNEGPGNDSYEEDEYTEQELKAIRAAEQKEEEEEEDHEGQSEDHNGAPSEAAATLRVDMGTGADSATLRRGVASFDFGGSARLTTLGGFNFVDIAAGGSHLDFAGGHNMVTVGNGNSRAMTSGGINWVTFGAGNSTYTATGGVNWVTFGTGNGVFTGGPGLDTAVFGNGNNTFNGGGGNDQATLGKGNDSAKGGPGADTIAGGSGRDSANGGPGRDKLSGGKSNDKLVGGPGKDQLNGGPGNRDNCLSGERLIACELPSHCPKAPDACEEACPHGTCHRPRRPALSSSDE